MAKEGGKHIHIIGICGVATSALAIAFQDKGWKVTGSDKGFFPPVSTELEKAGIDFYPGWHPEKMGTPDIVVAGASGTSPSNPEIIYAKENKIPVLSFAQALGKYIVKKNSIVVVGTWGKTSASALLSFILLEAGMNPSYFTGGISLSHKTGAMSESDWSVVEGDEYQAAIWDRQAKFFYYSPTHLLLTAVSWDHADLYPTEKSYFETFEKLIGKIPKSGLIVVNNEQALALTIAKKGLSPLITYGKKNADYTFRDVLQTKDGLDFSILHEGKKYQIHSPMIGAFQAENITGCFAMAYQIGIQAEKIVTAVSKFQGLKRRLEKRYKEKITIFDDIAHSPEKASSVLKNLRDIYDGKIIAVFEPNIGGRKKEALAKYANAFESADLVIIPRLSKLKISDNDEEKPLEGDELAGVISQTHKNVLYVAEDKNLVETLKKESRDGDVIVFLGSHGFRGMIEETVSAFTSPRPQYQ